jgi:uncharacterized protein
LSPSVSANILQAGPGTALITGASAGIGRELARVFANNGHDLVLVARRAKRLQELKTELEGEYGIAVHILPADLNQPDAPDQIHAAAQQAGHQINYLVNNAGVGQLGPFANMELERVEAMLAINIAALTRLTRLFVPEMLQRRQGYILNLASTAAFQPGPLMAIYYASKAYVLSFSEALANELQSSGVSVTALCPGPTQSDFHSDAGMYYSGYLKKSMPTAAQVAAYGYQAMLRRKRVAVHGWRNRLLALAVRLTPRGLVLLLGRRLAEAKAQKTN